MLKLNKGVKLIEISKELLSEVLNVEISEVTGMLTHKNNKSLLSYITKNCSINEGKELINIYELSFKCKEWAYSKGYSYLGNKGLINIYSKTETIVAITDKNVINWFDVYIDFKACEWILNKLNGND